ncbi:hypothetical protein LSUB1_G008839 [Lachnellula subtilissima]|uniref:PH domain-containing protein n=1 Tax=Lachnellula subtilissima TaxID=602034 RepID=A0A8H8RC86_9HELO|nr:hypothetical protein LSUB1_G008839 [Lachnellula subtilissima]
MIIMEGMMTIPPERGTLIGRAMWKPRYVVFGTGAPLKAQIDALAESTGKSSSGRKGLKSTSSKPSLVDVIPQAQESQEQTLYISIYKAKGDWEYLAQHPITSFKSCEIRNIQHRKQGASLPTLMIEFKPDSTSEKQRKRRSSRTGGLTSSKDPWANILLFRTIQEERYNIYDWQAAVKPNLTPDAPDDSPLTPSSPSYSFTNPFSSRETKSQTSSTGRPDYQRTASSQNNTNTYPHAQRSAMISPSPSLRSRRSDLSSQASSLHPPMGFSHNQIQNYNPTLPSDLPSPASTSGYDSQFIEGWTSAQGRSSALSSHTRGSNSIASAVAPIAPPIGSTPPGPRETILDRAFQLKYIPGGDRAQDREEDKISSIARFEALMREADERKKHRTKEESAGPTSKWDLDEESEGSDDDLNDEDDETNGLEMSNNDIAMPTPAQRALDYISGRRTPIPSSNRPISPAPRSPPIPFLNSQAMSAFHGPPPSSGGGLRPRAGTTSSRNNTSRPSSLALPPRSVSSITIPSLKDANSSGSNLKTSSSDKEKRSSSTSVKRLSFQEFAKRLSSTSSLLLVQTNASSSSGRDGSRRTSSEYGPDNEDRSDKDGQDKRCGWRGSVGVFGGEGGFL